MLTVEWVLYVRNYDLSWAGGAPGAGYLEVIFISILMKWA